MMQFSKIKTEESFAPLYDDMRGQFPVNELKSYEHFLSYLNLPEYNFYKIDNSGYIFVLEIEDYIWIDYFAIFKNKQQKGFGSKALANLKEKYKNKKGIFLEVQKISDDDLVTKKRQDFYIKNGGAPLNIDYFFPNKEGGLNMDLFYIKLNDNSAPDTAVIKMVAARVFNLLHFDIKPIVEICLSKIK